MAYTKKQIDSNFDSICERREQGQSVNLILKNSDMQSSRTFWKWLNSDDIDTSRYDLVIQNQKYKKRIKCQANVLGSRAKKLNDYRRDNARKVNQVKFPNSSIYIIKSKDDNIYKIGVSSNPSRRLKDIEAILPFDIETILVKKVNQAYDLEFIIHNYLKEHHLKGEWFKLQSIKEIINIIETWEQEGQAHTTTSYVKKYAIK